jgi:uncharacterized alkaline shock family protein YloU
MASRNSYHGITVAAWKSKVDGDKIVIDVYVIVQYGVRIRVVAESIQNTVKFHVEKALGLPVHAVNVYVQGLRMNDQQ